MIFDILGANAKNPNNKSQTLFFGIPKGTFYKKSPLAGYGAALYEEYGVDYVFFSSYEAQNGDLAALKEIYPLIYEGGAWYDEICVFAVSPRAQAAVQAG